MEWRTKGTRKGKIYQITFKDEEEYGYFIEDLNRLGNIEEYNIREFMDELIYRINAYKRIEEDGMISAALFPDGCMCLLSIVIYIAFNDVHRQVNGLKKVVSDMTGKKE